MTITPGTVDTHAHLRPPAGIRSATIFGANGIGLEKELGSIEVGKLADLVVMSANPLEDLRNTLAVEQVMVNGRLFEAETMDEVWPRQRALGYRGFLVDEPGGGRQHRRV